MGIQIKHVTEVLITGDGWRKIKPGSFWLPFYEYSTGDVVMADVGRALGNCPFGFLFVDAKTNEQVSGPITTLTAVKTVVPE